MRKFLAPISFLVAGAAVAVSVHLSQAADMVVGTGTAASCTEAAFDTAWNALAGTTGNITFNCGAAAHTIAFSSQKSLPADTHITINGASLITLDGQRNDGAGTGTRLFYMDGISSSLTLRNLTLTKGKAGVAYCGAAATETCGGIAWSRSGAVLTIENSTLSDSIADKGGALYMSGKVNLLNTTLSNNTAVAQGGAIYNFEGDVFADSVLLTSNNANMGGAIYNQNSTFVLTHSTVENNTATSNGGGVLVNGTTTITNSVINNNTAGVGAGVFNYGTLNYRNSTLSGNIASSAAGGIANVGNATFNFSTIANNTAPNVGGIFRAAGYVSLNQSVVSAGTTGANCGAAAAGIPVNNVAAESFSSDATCTTNAGTGVTVNANLLLGSLAMNGGLTKSHLPQTGSPLIDAANDCSFAGVPATDQRGAARPIGSKCDVGAIEVGSTAATATPSPTMTVTPSATPIPPTATPVPPAMRYIYLPIVIR